MACFYHHDRDSVGGCKSCGKGLCAECAVDLGKGLACRDRCEEDVRALMELVDRNIKLSSQTASLMDTTRKVRSSGAFSNLVFGTAFMAWGLSNPARFSFVILLGACFLALGAFGLFQARSKPARESPKS